MVLLSLIGLKPLKVFRARVRIVSSILSLPVFVVFVVCFKFIIGRVFTRLDASLLSTVMVYLLICNSSVFCLPFQLEFGNIHMKLAPQLIPYARTFL